MNKAYLFEIIGAMHEVSRELGPGLNEYIYQEALMIELEELGVEYQREKELKPSFHGKELNATYRLDFLCKKNVVVECKAVDTLTNSHRQQLWNYMRLGRHPYGVLVNFAPKHAEIERYYLDDMTKSISAF